MSNQLLLGFKICFIYSTLTLVTIIGSVFTHLWFNEHLIIVLLKYSIKLFFINYVFFMLFSLISIVINRVFALCIILVVGFVILAGWSAWNFYFDKNNQFFLTDNTIIHICMITIITLLFYFYAKNKEYF